MDEIRKLSILITSGPTRGYIDNVRFISNKSSGQLGAEIATEALKKGMGVALVHGIGSILPDIACLKKDESKRLTLVEIETVQDLSKSLREELKGKTFDVIIHAMAVLDYAPERPINGKLPSKKNEITIRFIKIPKIIKLLRELWPHSMLISFKLEAGISHEELLKRAYASLVENKADFVVANDQQEISEGKHPAYIINSQQELVATCNTKQDIAKRLIEIVSDET